MAQIIWTEAAVNDLSEIAEFIARDNADAATNLASQVVASVEQLAAFPGMGRIVPELDSARFRELIVPPCRVIYRNQREAVIILRIIRGERKLTAEMISGAN